MNLAIRAIRRARFALRRQNRNASLSARTLGLLALLAGSCVAAPAMAQAVPQPFGACPIEAYQTIQVGGSYGLYTINVGDGTLVLQGTDTELQGSNAANSNGINAIGFNEADRFIYGWNPSVHRVVRVGQGGTSEFVGATPAGLGSYSANVGDVHNGRLYLLSGNNMRIVDLATNAVQSLSTNIGSLTDWAFNGADNMLYAVRNSDGAIVRIDPATGNGAVVPGITVPANGTAFGAQYFDNQGSLYASRNDGIIYRIRNATGGGTPSVQVLTSAAPATGQNDGARCPNSAPPVASVNVVKQLVAESGAIAGRAEADELLTYRFTLTNAGRAATGSSYAFFEVLPANTTLVSVTGSSTDCATGSVGARLCTMTVPGPVAANGGTAIATMVVRVANPIPAGVARILNLVTDDANTAPNGCSATNQPCSPAPTCDPATDPRHCVALPLPSSDLRISKTNTPTAGADDQPGDTIASGAQTTYTIVVTNNGPDATTGALLKDPAPAGLGCTTPATCTGTGCPAASVPVAMLQGAGVTMGTMNAGDSATFELTCTVD